MYISLLYDRYPPRPRAAPARPWPFIIPPTSF